MEAFKLLWDALILDLNIDGLEASNRADQMKQTIALLNSNFLIPSAVVATEALKNNVALHITKASVQLPQNVLEGCVINHKPKFDTYFGCRLIRKLSREVMQKIDLFRDYTGTALLVYIGLATKHRLFAPR